MESINDETNYNTLVGECNKYNRNIFIKYLLEYLKKHLSSYY